MIRGLEKLRIGTVSPKDFSSEISTQRASCLNLSRYRDVESSNVGSVTTIDIDSTEGRYLISGGSFGTLVIHDLDNITGTPKHTCKVVAKVSKDSRHCHLHSIETVQWFPHDTGIFTSSGMDQQLKIWDTNVMKPVEKFLISGRIFQHHMSPIATNHCLIAVGRSAQSIILVDMKSGSAVQELRGHTSNVLTVKWSSRDEFTVAAGAENGRILLWDVRKARGVLQTLDRYNSQLGSSNSKKKKTELNVGALAHDGRVNGLCFTQDGTHLMSFGTDCRLRLWNTKTWKNEDINYGKIDNESRRALKFDISSNTKSDIVFVPSEGNLIAFEVRTGVCVNTMVGHFNLVNCVRYHPFYQEVYSGGNDKNILIWTADQEQSLAYQEYLKSSKPDQNKSVSGWKQINTRNVTADAWSSDESEGDGS